MTWIAAFVLSGGIVAAGEAKADPSVKQLIAALDSEKDDGRRIQLVKRLAALKSPAAMATLSVEMANARNPTVTRIEALKGLEALNDSDARDAIAIAAMKSDSVAVRARAIDAIGNLRLRDFVPACIRGLSSSESSIRRSALDALTRFNDLRLAARALPFVGDGDAAVRRSARLGASLCTLKLSLFVLRLG